MSRIENVLTRFSKFVLRGDPNSYIDSTREGQCLSKENSRRLRWKWATRTKTDWVLFWKILEDWKLDLQLDSARECVNENFLAWWIKIFLINCTDCTWLNVLTKQSMVSQSTKLWNHLLKTFYINIWRIRFKEAELRLSRNNQNRDIIWEKVCPWHLSRPNHIFYFFHRLFNFKVNVKYLLIFMFYVS